MQNSATPKSGSWTKQTLRPAPPTGGESLKTRLALRDDFFNGRVDAKQLLQPFDHLPGLLYFVKDGESRIMAMSRDVALRV